MLSELSAAFRLDVVPAFQQRLLSLWCVGNSVQGESLAFITAEPPETFTVEQKKQSKTNTQAFFWLIQFKFGASARKCSNKKTLIKKEIHMMSNRSRGRSSLVGTLRKAFFKWLL